MAIFYKSESLLGTGVARSFNIVIFMEITFKVLVILFITNKLYPFKNKSWWLYKNDSVHKRRIYEEHLCPCKILHHWQGISSVLVCKHNWVSVIRLWKHTKLQTKFSMGENEPLPFFQHSVVQRSWVCIEDTPWQMQLVYDAINCFSEIMYKMHI